MLPLAHFEKRYAITEQGQIINLANNQPLKPTKNENLKKSTLDVPSD